MLRIGTIAAAAALASFSIAPAFAQDAGMNCTSFSESSHDDQMSWVEAMLMEIEGAEGSASTNEEITSMLLEQCNEFPDREAVSLLRELPLAVQQ